MPRCAGRKEDGSPCERIVGASQTHCYSHDPKRAAECRRNASRGGRSKANAEIAGLNAQLKKLAADVLSGEVERGAATAVSHLPPPRLHHERLGIRRAVGGYAGTGHVSVCGRGGASG
jgi:hypothetical protein